MVSMNRRILKMTSLFAVLALLASASILASPSAASSGMPVWEFKGAYANYSFNYSAFNFGTAQVNSSNKSPWKNLTGYEYSRISSVGEDNYSLYYGEDYLPLSLSGNASGHYSVIHGAVDGNSSFLVLINNTTDYRELYPAIMPAVNVTVLNDLIANKTSLYIGGAPWVLLEPHNNPVKVSHILYDYNGREIKAIEGSININISIASNSRQIIGEYVIISPVSGLIMSYSINESIYSTKTGNVNQSMFSSDSLHSTNIPLERSFWNTNATPLIILVIVVVAIVIISALLIIRKTKATKQ